MNHDAWSLLANWLRDILASIAPAAFGSAVGQAWSAGLTWRQRLVQWMTGILVSFYVTMGLAEWLHVGPFGSQAFGFTIAMIAFEVAPKVIAAAGATATAIPSYVAEFVAKWTR